MLLARLRGAALRAALRPALARALSVQAGVAPASRTLEGVFQGAPFNEGDYQMFPRAGPGHDYELNWAMSELDVHVYNRCWRSPCRGQLQRALGTPCSGEGAMVLAREIASDESVESVPEDSMDSPQEEVVVSISYRRAQVKRYLSEVSDLFVVDGSLGSCRHAAERTRVVTDDPATCWIMKNLLEPAPEAPLLNSQSVCAFLAQTCDALLLGRCKEPDLAIQSVYSAGPVRVGRLMEELAAAYKSVPSKSKRVLLNGHLLRANGATSLIMGAPTLVPLALKTGCLYSAHHTILGEGYACKLWGGCVTPCASGVTPRKGALSDGSFVYSVLSTENAAELPGTILLARADKDPNTMSEVPYDSVPQLLQEQQQMSKEEIQTLMEILKLGNIEVYIAGTSTVEQAIASLKRA